MKMLNRFSQDKSLVNTHGRRLIDLCSLLILNGRLGSDIGVGAYTRVDTTGKRVVDYMIGYSESFAISSDLIVHEKFSDSDHVPFFINCRLRCVIPSKSRTHKHMWTKHYRYGRSLLNVRELENVLNDEISMPFREQVSNSFIYMKSSNDLAICLTSYILRRLLIDYSKKKIRLSPSHQGEVLAGMIMNVASYEVKLLKPASESLRTVTVVS